MTAQTHDGWIMAVAVLGMCAGFVLGFMFRGALQDTPDPATVPCEIVCECQFDLSMGSCTIIKPGQVPGEEGK